MSGAEHVADAGAARAAVRDDRNGKIVVLRPVRRIKAEPIDPVAAAEKQQSENEENKKNGHEITPKTG